MLYSLLEVSEVIYTLIEVSEVIYTLIKISEVIYTLIYLDPNEMSGRSYLCTCPQTILLFDKGNRIRTLLTHR